MVETIKDCSDNFFVTEQELNNALQEAKADYYSMGQNLSRTISPQRFLLFHQKACELIVSAINQERRDSLLHS